MFLSIHFPRYKPFSYLQACPSVLQNRFHTFATAPVFLLFSPDILSDQSHSPGIFHIKEYGLSLPAPFPEISSMPFLNIVESLSVIAVAFFLSANMLSFFQPYPFPEKLHFLLPL